MTKTTTILTSQDARQLMASRVFLFIHGRAEIKLPIKISEEKEIKEHDRWLFGRITDVDRSMIEVTDTGEEVHLFKVSKVIECRPVAIKGGRWKLLRKFAKKQKPNLL